MWTMNKNTIIGSILIAVIMIWWMATMPKPQPVPQKSEQAITSEESQEVKKESKGTLEIPALKTNSASTLEKAPAFSLISIALAVPIP